MLEVQTKYGTVKYNKSPDPKLVEEAARYILIAKYCKGDKEDLDKKEWRFLGR